MSYGALPATSGADLRCEGGGINRAAASAKRLGDGGHDKTERGEPTHSPDQQLRHAAVVPCCQRRRLIRGKEQKEPVSKKRTPRRQRGSVQVAARGNLIRVLAASGPSASSASASHRSIISRSFCA